MKTLFRSVLIGLLIGTQAAWAGLPPTTAKGLNDASPSTTFNLQVPESQSTRINGTTALLETGNANKLVNPGFEASGVTGWAISGAGSLSTSNTTVLAGKQSGSLTLATQSGAVYQDVTPAIATPGVPYEHSIWAMTTASSIQVCGRQGGVEIQCTPVSSDGQWHRYTLNLSAPSSGSVGVDVSSSASTTGTVYFDEGYVGPARNIAQVSQAQLYGTITIYNCSGTFSFPTTLSTWDDTTATGCSYAATGSLSAPSSNYLGFRAALSTGAYLVIPGGGAVSNTSGAGYLRLSNGTINSLESAAYVNPTSGGDGIFPPGGFTIQVSSQQAAADYRIQEYHGAGNALAFSANSATTAGPAIQTFAVYKIPSSSQTALTPDAGGLAAGDILATAATACPTGTILADGSSQLRASLPALFNAIGTTYGSVDGTHFTLPDYRGLFLRGVGTNGTLKDKNGTGSFATSGALGAYQQDQFQGHTHAATYISTGGSNNWVGTAASFQQLSNTGGATTDGINGTPSSGAETRPMNTAVTYCIRTVQASPAPLLMGSVTSSSSGIERIEHAYMGAACSSGTCASVTSTPGISSITWGSTGVYTVNFAAGTFSAAPTCTVSGLSLGASHGWCQGNGLATTSAQGAFCGVSSTGAAQNDQFSVICTGPH